MAGNAGNAGSAGSGAGNAGASATAGSAGDAGTVVNGNGAIALGGGCDCALPAPRTPARAPFVMALLAAALAFARRRR
jgi:MYXO-CTERM domain-containing protein